MEKRGVKKSALILSIFIILIISISLVSANFFTDLFKKFITPTGQAAGGGDSCVDSDGANNYNVAGTVTVGIDEGSIVYYDVCEGNIAYDYYCDPGGIPRAAAFLPLTGEVISDPPLPAKVSSKNCATSGQICWSGGRCGCSATEKNVVCGPPEAGIGVCTSGYTNCVNGNYGPCQGAVYPSTEICDGLDNDCDYWVDEGSVCAPQCSPATCSSLGKQCGSWDNGTCSGTLNCGTCPSGQTCNVNGICETPQEGCTDSDGDRYAVQSNPGTCNNLCKDGQTCLGGNDCNDTNININPGKTDTTCDGIDNNCASGIDEAGTTWCLAQPSYGANYTCIGGLCIPPSCQAKTKTQACDNVGRECGPVSDGCGGTISCGICGEGLNCSETVGQCNPPGTVSCNNGESRECGANVGECKKGIETCVNREWSGNCAGETNSVAETCDNKDNDCNNETDDGLIGSEIICYSEEYGCVGVLKDCFQGVSFDTCGKMNLKEIKTAEICGDDIDDNCDPIGSLVDGCTGCTDGEKSTCQTGNLCETAEQTCTNGEWGDCEVVSTDSNCNEDTICTPLEQEICGKNVGICSVGSRTCQRDGTWGECTDVKPISEVCNDNLDNDCDGQADEGCDTGNQESCQLDNECPQDYECKNNLCSAVDNENNEDGTIEEESTSFWDKLINFFLAIFRVGQVLLGGSITPSSTTATEVFCADSDNGNFIFVKGSGEGLNQQDVKTFFADTCFEEDLNNQVESCAEDNCYLAEYFCENKHVKYERSECNFGCSNGACVPTRDQSQECEPYFDEVTFQLVDPC